MHNEPKERGSKNEKEKREKKKKKRKKKSNPDDAKNEKYIDLGTSNSVKITLGLFSCINSKSTSFKKLFVRKTVLVCEGVPTSIHRSKMKRELNGEKRGRLREATGGGGGDCEKKSESNHI